MPTTPSITSGTIAAIEKVIPGYPSYLGVDRNRISDQMVRNYVVGRLNETRRLLEGLAPPQPARVGEDALTTVLTALDHAAVGTQVARFANSGGFPNLD